MFDSCPNRGWGTEDARTNEFAIQTYCFSPPTSLMIVGSAVVMMATSRAEMKDSRQRAINTPQNRNEREDMGVAVMVIFLLPC
jgi:hypothetical protein